MGDALPKVELQRTVAAKLREFLPERSVLWQEEDTRPYECDGLTAYRQVPMVVALPETEEQVQKWFDDRPKQIQQPQPWWKQFFGRQ